MKPSLLDKYKDIIIEKHGVTLKSWELGLDVWTKKFGISERSQRDFVWSVFNEVINLIGQSANNEEDLYTKQREVYFSMWKFLIDEKRDASHIKKQINNCFLRIAKAKDRASPFKTEIHIIGTKCCTECDKLDMKVISIDEALEQQLLPNPNCTRRNGCVCGYSEMFVMNEVTGRLIRK